jgi:1-acyl-sn-glycerol-3-phosphate acyltransferase
MAEFDQARVKKALRVLRHYADYFSTRLTHAERIPREGGALIVSNHAVYGLDSPALFVRIYEETGRVPRGLAEHFMMNLPIVGNWLRSLGAVDGTPEAAVQMLEQGELMVVYPGGHREALKAWKDRYQLKWKRSRGYIRCAIRAQVPVIPVAGAGIDEALITVGHENVVGRKIFGRKDYDIPIAFGLGLLPLPVAFRFEVGEPVHSGLPPEAADDDRAVDDLHERVTSATQDLIIRANARRFSPADA